MKEINDPGNYRKMSEPYRSSEEASSALDAFYEAVKELRNTHKITDVLMVVCVNVTYEEGEGAVMSRSHYGDPLKSESMAAYAYGAEQTARKQWITRLLSGKKNGE